jgi:hypothetical protein
MHYPTQPKVWTDGKGLTPVFIDLAGVSSSGRLHRRTPNGQHVWRLSNWMCFGRVQPCFFLPFGFKGSDAKLSRLCHHGTCLSSMVKSVVENGTEAEIWGLVLVVRVLVMMRFWLGDLWLGVTTLASGGNNTWEIHCPNLQDKNPRSDLNWLCLAMILSKVLFYERGLSPRWKPMINDQGDDGACTLLPS